MLKELDTLLTSNPFKVFEFSWPRNSEKKISEFFENTRIFISKLRKAVLVVYANEQYWAHI